MDQTKISYDIGHFITDEPATTDTLNPHYIQTLLDPSIHSVEIQYSSSTPDSTYTYLTRLKLKKGNTVVIETPQGYYRTVKVTKFHKIPNIHRTSRIDYKWVVSKIPTKKYKKHKKENKKIIQSIQLQHLDAIRNADLNNLTYDGRGPHCVG